MINLADYRNETDKATQIIRLQRQIEFLTHQRDEFRKALKLIGNLPYDDKEKPYPDQDGNKEYYWLTHSECSEYLCTAVDTALDALWRA